jgi:hypothetical protein
MLSNSTELPGAFSLINENDATEIYINAMIASRGNPFPPARQRLRP